MNPSIDQYIAKTEKWHDVLVALRMICLDCGLNEELKWKIPVYTYNKKNIVCINGLKNFCAFAFFKGALLQDTDGILATPGKVQSARWVKFTTVKEIIKLESTLRAYIFQAIEVEKAGLKIKRRTTADFKIVEEFKDRLDESAALKKAFNSLTPGRQRAYLIYFADAKLSKTRAARVEKCIPHILKGMGLTY
jgi:uncharacterized protein YdeI (YjbR/CyaY-like superfamily)